MKIYFLISYVLVFSLGCSVFGVQGEEELSYRVVMQKDNKEVRRYAPHIVATTKVDGTYDEAQSKGFKILAGYIFGKNLAQTKIKMTAPVIQKSKPVSENISMTAPVIISPSKAEANVSSWTMSFSMPAKYELSTLPKPTDERVILKAVDEKYIAAIKFSGFWGLEKNKNKANELKVWVEGEAKYLVTSEAMFAGYNPPWTLPFFRRNEMLFDLNKSK